MTDDKLQELINDGADRSELVDYLKKTNQQVVDLEKLKSPDRVWTDRGLVVTSDRGDRIFKRRM